MNCKICGSSEFCANDGITYCTVCQSQIEETQTEEAVEHVVTREISSPGLKKTTPVKKKKELSDWITVEYFNQVLHMQVSALIKLGASPKLKKTVLYIWSKYLQKCEIAFRTDYQASDGKPHLGPVPFKRDIKVLYGNKNTSSSRKRKNSEVSLDTESIDTDIKTEDSDDFTSDTESVISEKSCEKIKFSCHARKLLRKSTLKEGNWKTYSKSIFNINIQKTLVVCYLGLLYTEDQLSLLDLIRLVYEGQVPYIDIIDKVPLSSKLLLGDRSAFQKYTVPDAYSLLKFARELVAFLKLPPFKEPSVFVAVSRFIKDLNLPNDLKPVVKILMDRYKEQLSVWMENPKIENVPHDYQALVFIILALKMLFVLDDSFEIDHSQVINKLNVLNEGNKYFEWEEWRKQSVIKEYLFLCQDPGFCSINKLDSLSADKMISKYPFTHLRELTDEDRKNYRDCTVQKHNISNMLSNIVNIPDFSGSTATSFPLQSAVNCFAEEWKSLPMFKETQEIDFSLLQKDFSSRSLSFNPSQFDKIDDELSYLLMTSLYSLETSVKLGQRYDKQVTFCQNVIKTTSKYWYFNFGEELPSGWFEKHPNSFKWLMNFISKYAYCDKLVLYKEMSVIERRLFLQRKTLKVSNLSDLSNKIVVNF